jgi:hypothetical protein
MDDFDDDDGGGGRETFARSKPAVATAKYRRQLAFEFDVKETLQKWRQGWDKGRLMFDIKGQKRGQIVGKRFKRTARAPPPP